jgi:hypothetical protein
MSTSAQLRQAALLVHAMTASDRDWLLAALSSSQRTDLCPLLDELRELGIPADPSFLEQVSSIDQQSQAAAVNSHADPDQAHATALQFLNQLTQPQVTILSTMLRNEPAMLTARLLHMRIWPWSQSVLAQWDALQRRQVQHCRHTLQEQRQHQAPALAFETALVQLLHQRLLREAPVQPPQKPAIVSWKQHWIYFWRRLEQRGPAR